VKVAAARGGIGQAVLLIATLLLVAGAFLVGLAAGGVAILAAPVRAPVVFEQLERSGGQFRVAIIDVQGAIDDATAVGVRRAVDHVLADRSFRAVVLRVDSPGGGVSPSDRIRAELARLAASGLPIVASYGGVAASGGVYVSAEADAIVCEPTAMTGSVGVIASILTFGRLLDTLGVQPVTLVAAESPRKSEANDVFRNWTDQDRAAVQRFLDHAYRRFAAIVADARVGKARDADALRAVLDGRVLTADEALEVGLVDAIGYLDDAIAEAERRAGLARSSCTVVRIVQPRSLLSAPFLSRVGDRIGDQPGYRGASLLEPHGLRRLLEDAGSLRIEYRLQLP
jgi:protease-4